MLQVDPGGRGDLLAFAERAVRLDEAAVVRLRNRKDGLLAAWVTTGFEVSNPRSSYIRAVFGL